MLNPKFITQLLLTSLAILFAGCEVPSIQGTLILSSTDTTTTTTSTTEYLILSSVSPTSGSIYGGTTLTLTGTGFKAGNISIQVGGNPCTPVNFVNSTSIQCTLPAHSVGSANVVLTNGDGYSVSISKGYTYTSVAPTFTSITPSSGTMNGGTGVLILGSNFLPGAMVTLDGYSCNSVTYLSSNSLFCFTAGHYPGSVSVSVINPDLQSVTSPTLGNFTYTPTTLAVTQVSPTAGGSGVQLAIYGTGFLIGATVTVGGGTCTSPVVISSGLITCTTPIHVPGAVDVVVTNTLSPFAGSSTLASSYTYKSIGGQIVTGYRHSCIIIDSGVQCWGDNTYGQLGNNSTSVTPVTTPVTVVDSTSTPIKGVTALTAGFGSTCAVVKGGVMCWGLNDHGQLGDTTTTNSSYAVTALAVGSGAKSVSMGYTIGVGTGNEHVCAIALGGVLCWGSNDHKQATGGASADILAPAYLATIPASSGAQAVASGASHSCAIIQGTLKCWGANDYGQLGNGAGDGLTPIAGDEATPVSVVEINYGATEVSAGASHTCAIVSGNVKCWGLNSSGQLGYVPTSNRLYQSTPGAVATSVSGIALTDVQFSLTSGLNHNCVIVNGTIQCWGLNSSGQIGNNTVDNQQYPTSVLDPASLVYASAIYLSGAQFVSAGAAQTCALVNGGAQCWGNAAYGQLGNQSTSYSQQNIPVKAINYSNGIQNISVGLNHSCILANGGLQCWGSNDYGQLGTGTTSTSPTALPTAVLNSSNSPMKGVQAVSVGLYHTCALVNGLVYCFGRNIYGQLGNGTNTDSAYPVQVENGADEPLTGVQAITSGDNHSCAITAGAAYCWGSNSRGQLGISSNVDSNVAVINSTLTTGVLNISSGSAHSCALYNETLASPSPTVTSCVASPTPAPSLCPATTSVLISNGVGIACWGANDQGQAGLTGYADTNFAVPLTGSSAAEAVAAGYEHSCLIKGGKVQCWGGNSDGQIGVSTATTKSDAIVTAVTKASDGTDLTGVVSLSLGLKHSCALAPTTSESLYCWGNNSFGQFGTGAVSASTYQATPAATGGGEFSFLGSGGYSTCAQIAGAAYCWGDDTLGQLGTVDPITPTPQPNAAPVIGF